MRTILLISAIAVLFRNSVIGQSKAPKMEEENTAAKAARDAI